LPIPVLPVPSSDSEELRDHLAGEAFHLLFVIEKRVDQDQLGACRRDVP